MPELLSAQNMQLFWECLTHLSCHNMSMMSLLFFLVQIIKNTLVLACMQTQLQSFHVFVFNLCPCAEASNTCVNCTRWHWRRMRAVWVEAGKCTGKIPNWPFGQTSWTASVGQRRNSVWESCEPSMYLSLLLACSWSRTQTGWATENPRLLCPHLYTDPMSRIKLLHWIGKNEF